ncbi:MAG: DUF4290 domain-containing protein [Bacteroidia bacterium]|nr:DUF4290 domain-containing protein [Bacteroidia bacterium]MCO5253017.1 DUF4290 domain-containing protein [Bacteroidota bacterium]MCZ2131139.1 DUF4290 domain-containing protein [Bacteroidia bacterium]
MERNTALVYNTERKDMVISEYGRIVHDYVELICAEPDRNKRTRMAHGLISIMENLKPQVKEQEDYKHKLWDHLYIISNFRLDVDSPFQAPKPENTSMHPEPIPYPTQPIKFRFYGRNLQYMVNKAAEIDDKEVQKDFLSILASFMKNSSRSWNNEDLTNEMVTNHLKSMSGGKISIDFESLDIRTDDTFQRKTNGFKPNKNKGFSKRHKNNRNKNRYR